MDPKNRVQIQDEAVCVLIRASALENAIESIVSRLSHV